RATRQQVRASVPNFIEVYVQASLETCMRRDVKGMYRKALAGEIKNFTGVDDPYEPPLKPEIAVDTEHLAPNESVDQIVKAIEMHGFGVPPARLLPERSAQLSFQLSRI